MDNLKDRIQTLVEEIQIEYLHKTWTERLIASGIDEHEAYKWIAEIGHVIDEYRRNLGFIADLFEKDSPTLGPEKINDWAAYTHDMGVFIIEGATSRLQDHLKKYLPPEPEDEDESV